MYLHKGSKRFHLAVLAGLAMAEIIKVANPMLNVEHLTYKKSFENFERKLEESNQGTCIGLSWPFHEGLTNDGAKRRVGVVE